MGKTYVCSDIHGMGGTYLDTLKKLNKDDVLYILGDATDRGDEGIGILYDIMKHNGENSQKPQIKYILGNHDLMLIENMETIMKYNIKIKDIQRYSNLIKMCNELYDKRVWGEGSGRENYEQIKKAFPELENATFEEVKVFAEQIYNDGENTLWAFMNIDREKQQKLYDFLENSILQTNIEVKNKNFILTHAVPFPTKTSEIEFTLKEFRNKNRQRKNNIDIDRGLWKYISARDKEADAEWMKWKENGFFTICGHTPQSKKTQYSKDLGRLIIDTGIYQNGDMALVCIDDGKLEMVQTRGKRYGKEYVSKQYDYKEQEQKVKDIFDEIMANDKYTVPRFNNFQKGKPEVVGQRETYDTEENENVDYTATIKDMSGKKSMVEHQKEIEEKMRKGERPNPEDIKFLIGMRLDLENAKTDIYTEQDKKHLSDLLIWGGIKSVPSKLEKEREALRKKLVGDVEIQYTETMKDMPGQKSKVQQQKEMQERMKNGERPTSEDIELLTDLAKQPLDSEIYSEEDKKYMSDLLAWGGLNSQTSNSRDKGNGQKLVTGEDYEKMYRETRFNQRDSIINRFKKLKERSNMLGKFAGKSINQR